MDEVNVTDDELNPQNETESKKDERKGSNNTNDKKRMRLYRLPLARVKHIMKLDPECSLISQEALILVTKATELFIELLSKEAVKYTNSSKRKTVMKRDLDMVIEKSAPLCFLEGMLD